MEKDELKDKLKACYDSFIKTVDKLSTDEFEYAPDQKWSAGQHAEHLLKSVKAVKSGMGLPRFVIKQKFGKANRPSRTYEEVVEKYRAKLALGPVTNTTYSPGQVPFSKKEKLLHTLSDTVGKLEAKIDRWSEEQLDAYVFPHPLLGKMTIREMIYFTSYHAEHHRRLIKLYLKGV